MISRDNHARAELNETARAVLKAKGTLARDGVVIAEREICEGERVIARRNDRHRDVDNGTPGTVTDVDRLTGALTIRTDSGTVRRLDASYVAEHVEHGYALTGHGAQGGTIEWAGVIGTPSEFTAEWAYTALSRARESTRIHVIAETSPRQRERQQYAPPEPDRSRPEALMALRAAMRRRETEPLAIEHIQPAELPKVSTAARSPAPLRVDRGRRGVRPAQDRPPASP